MRSKTNKQCASGLTLIELILVMALLATVLAIAAPRLANFFRGRDLNNEADRFLSLTRYGQSRAVSSGVPMILWLHVQDGSFGLREEAGYSTTTSPRALNSSEDIGNEDQAVQFKLTQDLSFVLAADENITNGEAIIRFSPDGAVDESSVEQLSIKDNRDDSTVPIVLSYNRLKYEIADQTYQVSRMRR